MGRGDVRGVDGEHAAGNRGHHGAPVADQVPHQGNARGGGQRGEHPGDRERLHRGDRLGQQRDRQHQLVDARRLDGREVHVGQLPLGDPDRAADVHAVVVLGDAGQEPGPGQREEPDGEREHRRDQHHLAGVAQPVVAQPRTAESGVLPFPAESVCVARPSVPGLPSGRACHVTGRREVPAHGRTLAGIRAAPDEFEDSLRPYASLGLSHRDHSNGMTRPITVRNQGQSGWRQLPRKARKNKVRRHGTPVTCAMRRRPPATSRG